MVVRTSWMVASSSSTALPIPSCTSGTTERRAALSSIIPVANSRWMTRSCRSRAIRSRSWKTASRCWSCWPSASRRARADCEAKVWASCFSDSVNVGAPLLRQTQSPPSTRPAATIGTAIEAPKLRARRSTTAGSVDMSSRKTLSPASSWAAKLWAGISSPVRYSAASPEACATFIWPSPVGSRIMPTAASASCRTCSAATVRAACASSVESSAVVTAEAPAIQRSRRRPSS